MNTYSIKISGIHCQGCKNLITMSLEDENFLEINVNENSATFKTDLQVAEVKEILDRIFSEISRETKYSYSDLKII